MSCDVQDLTVDGLEISIPQLCHPADLLSYDRSGLVKSEFESVCFNITG